MRSRDSREVGHSRHSSYGRNIYLLVGHSSASADSRQSQRLCACRGQSEHRGSADRAAAAPGRRTPPAPPPRAAETAQSAFDSGHSPLALLRSPRPTHIHRSPALDRHTPRQTSRPRCPQCMLCASIRYPVSVTLWLFSLSLSLARHVRMPPKHDDAVAYLHVPGPPPELRAALSCRACCRGRSRSAPISQARWALIRPRRCCHSSPKDGATRPRRPLLPPPAWSGEAVCPASTGAAPYPWTPSPFRWCPSWRGA